MCLGRLTCVNGTLTKDNSLWGFYLGRPFHTNAGNITVEKPWPDTSKPQSMWSPCGADEVNSSDAEYAVVPDEIVMISQRWVTLCGVMDVLGNVM